MSYEAYNIAEKRVKSKNRTLFYRKILIVFADICLDQLTSASDLVRLEHILRFSKIEGSIVP